jgi:Anti-sigma-K factor rskA
MRHECPVRPEDVGPYLLGQLGPDEAAAVAETVDACPSCAAEVARLRPVVQALARGTAPLEEEAPTAPPPALERVLASVRDERTERRRRLHRRVALAAAAAVLVFATAVGAVVLSERGADAGGGGRDVALSGSSAAAGNVEMSGHLWGTAMTLEVRGLTPGTSYGAWLADRSGKRVSAGTFRPTATGSAHLELSASLPLPDASAVGVTEIGGDDVLLGDLRPRVDRS